MKNAPFVSVLIPVFNREHHIAECIQSALDQNYNNYEIVIVDNASSDQTAYICREIASKNSKIRFFENNKNLGPVGNWQRCVREARGEVAKILFSDDLLLPDCLSVMVNKLEDDVAFVYSPCLVGEFVEGSIVRYGTGKDEFQTTKEFINALINGDAPVSPGAILLRMSDLRNNLRDDFATAKPHPFARYGAGSDVMIALLTAEHYSKISTIEKPLVFFRAHPGSLTLQNEGNAVRECYLATLSLYLKNVYGKNAWIRYLALQWMAEIIKTKKITRPRTFLCNYEGAGTLTEILKLLLNSIEHFYIFILLRKKIIVV